VITNLENIFFFTVYKFGDFLVGTSPLVFG